MTRIMTRPVDSAAMAALMAAGLNEFEARIYAARGITRGEELSMEFSNLLPFHSLKNIDAAVARLIEAITARARILIVADYDADGATACAVAVKGLAMLGAVVDYLIPNRFEDGYGLTPEIVDEAAKRQPELIVTVDNGIASVAGVARARTYGIDVLITDHHLPGDILPDAIIVNPNQPGCLFPSKNLAGVGVIFYLLLALRAALRTAGAFATQREPNLANLLDLVALGTVADVVTLDSNNRLLVAQGLKRIRAGLASAGINALFSVGGRNPNEASTFDLGFTLAPRINAAGRLQDMSLGVACLLANDTHAAIAMAQQLEELNRERRTIESHIQEEAQTIVATLQVNSQYSVSLYQPEWHQGVIGIIASRLKEQYHRPCFVFAQSGADEIKGSGRSINGLHLRDTLDLLDKKAPGLLRRFGGHAMAAGVTIGLDGFPRFTALFEALCAQLLDEAALQKQLYVDGTPPQDAYSFAQVAKLKDQVWGQGFQAPLFIDTFEILTQRIVGEKHLKLQVKNRYGRIFEAMQFQSVKSLPARFSAVFRLSINTFQQRQSVQLIFQQIV